MQEDDGRKVPRAPWNNPEWPEKFVSHLDPYNWVEGRVALAESKRPFYSKFSPAFSIPNYEEQTLDGRAGERHVLVDHDDVINENGWHPASKRISDQLGTFTQVSQSGSGVHNVGRGQLPEGITSLTVDISNEHWPEAEVEIYDSGRYIHFTGKHVTGTPTETRDVSDLLERYADEHYEDPHEESDEDDEWPEVDEDALDRATTTSKAVLSEAMKRVDADDIWLRSEKTRDRASGSADYDPSWANSKSGTRLGKLGPDHFIYRDGNIKLNTLDVVALEEGIINRPGDTIGGKKWLDLAEALRYRGAQIPEYQP